MSHLERHVARKEGLLRAYDLLLENKHELFLDDGVEAISSASLREARENLAVGRFVVAVCGQMKAGKSTLLNALLFGRPVLASAPTTMTAKVTLAHGGAATEVRAALYTPSEFDAVVRAAATDDRARRELADARENAREKGVWERAILAEPRRVEVRDSLDALPEFTAVPDNGGLYTPFVQIVQLQADEPWLHQVTVADTPGTNDPNPERDRITKEWITRADAVLYVTYAGQAGMDAVDIAFLDTYLTHIDASKRIIVVNKCDVVNDTHNVLAHIRSIARSPDVRMQNLFRDESRIVLVSGLAGLIDRMRRTDRPRSDALAEEEVILEAEGWLHPERHGVERLRDLVEQSIINTSGVGMIEAHEQRIEGVIDRAERRVHWELDSTRQEIAALGASVEEREREILSIESKQRRLSEVVAHHHRIVGHAVEKVYDNVMLKIGELAGPTTDDVLRALKGVSRVNGLADQVPWAIEHAVQQRRGEIIPVLKELVAQVQTPLESFENDVSHKLLSSGIEGYEPNCGLLSLSAWSFVKKLEKSVGEVVRSADLAPAVTQATSFFQRTFNTTAGRDAGLEAIRPMFARQIKALFDGLGEDAIQSVKHLADKEIEGVEKRVASLLDSRQHYLRGLHSAAVDLGEERMRHKAALEAATARLTSLAALRSQVRSGRADA